MKTIQPEKEILTGEEEIILSPDEYFNPDDGLVYCSKCHNPKEIWLYSPVFSIPKKGIIACLCEKEKIQKQEEEEKIQREAEEQERLRLEEEETKKFIEEYQKKVQEAEEQRKLAKEQKENK